MMTSVSLICIAERINTNDDGETLVETLVSLLISSLALLLLSTAIATSVNLIMMSRDKMTQLYNDESKMVENTTPESITPSPTISFAVPLKIESGSPQPITVDVYLSGSSSAGDIDRYAYYEKKS